MVIKEPNQPLIKIISPPCFVLPLNTTKQTQKSCEYFSMLTTHFPKVEE